MKKNRSIFVESNIIVAIVLQSFAVSLYYQVFAQFSQQLKISFSHEMQQQKIHFCFFFFSYFSVFLFTSVATSKYLFSLMISNCVFVSGSIFRAIHHSAKLKRTSNWSSWARVLMQPFSKDTASKCFFALVAIFFCLFLLQITHCSYTKTYCNLEWYVVEYISTYFNK